MKPVPSTQLQPNLKRAICMILRAMLGLMIFIGFLLLSEGPSGKQLGMANAIQIAGILVSGAFYTMLFSHEKAWNGAVVMICVLAYSSYRLFGFPYELAIVLPMMLAGILASALLPFPKRQE